jgi:hypothetical protein
MLQHNKSVQGKPAAASANRGPGMHDKSTDTAESSTASFDVRIRITDEGDWGDYFPAQLIVTESQLVLSTRGQKHVFYPFDGGVFRQKMIISWWSMTFGRPIPMRADDLKWSEDEAENVSGFQIRIPKPVAETISVECTSALQTAEMEKAVRRLWV